MADLAAGTEDQELLNACRQLFGSIADRRMYVTGGIGSTVEGEAFTVDYDLPNDTAYAETCASIGLMFFASKMLEAEVDSKYADVMERAFYNTVLAGMQLDGKRFFYVNPLEVLPGISGEIKTHRHDLPQRPGWYACACCPPNVARCIASLGKYAYGENERTAFVHLFVEGRITFENGMVLECKTGYPYEFKVEYKVTKGSGEMAVRRPDWSSSYRILVNGTKAAAEEKNGYYYLKDLKAGEEVEIFLDDEIKKLYASTKIASDTGYVTLQRGPLVYCVEGTDNEMDVLSLSYAENGSMKAVAYEPALLGGTVRITADGYRTHEGRSLSSTGNYSMIKPEKKPCRITAIPYYTWGNRGLNQMRVWLPER